MRKELTKKDVYLGRFLYSHMDILNKWYSDSRMRKAVGTKPLTEEQKKRHFEYKFKNPKKYSRGIFLDRTDELIGYVSIKNLDKKNKTGNLEIIIDPGKWDKGFGWQAAQLVFEEARQLGLKKLFSDCAKENSRSLAFHKKLGFKKTRETDKMVFFEIEGF